MVPRRFLRQIHEIRWKGGMSNKNTLLDLQANMRSVIYHRGVYLRKMTSDKQQINADIRKLEGKLGEAYCFSRRIFNTFLKYIFKIKLPI